MWFGPPGRNQSANILTLINVNDRNFQVVDQTNGVDANFTIVEPVVHAFQRRAIEYPGGLGEPNTVPAYVDGVLHRIPSDTERLLGQNVLTIPTRCKGYDGPEVLTVP